MFVYLQYYFLKIKIKRFLCVERKIKAIFGRRNTLCGVFVSLSFFSQFSLDSPVYCLLSRLMCLFLSLYINILENLFVMFVLAKSTLEKNFFV